MEQLLGSLGGWYQAIVDQYLRDAIATFRIGNSEKIIARSEADSDSHTSAEKQTIIRHHVTTDSWRFDELHTAAEKQYPGMAGRSKIICGLCMPQR